MILDTISDGRFVFKNTFAGNKQLEIDVDAEEAPEEFFFLHIKYIGPSFPKEPAPVVIAAPVEPENLDLSYSKEKASAVSSVYAAKISVTGDLASTWKNSNVPGKYKV